MASAAGYHRQGILATDNSGVADTTIVATLPAPVRPGSLVIATVGWFSVGTDPGTDFPHFTADTALPSLFDMENQTGAGTFGMWTNMYANTITGPQQFTVTFDVATKFQWLAVDEYTNILTGPFPVPYDDTVSATSNSAITAVNVGTQVIYVAGFSTSGGSATPGSGFEGRQSGSLSGNNTFFLTEDDFETAVNLSFPVSFTTSGSSAVCLLNAVSLLASPLGLQVISQQWSDSWKDIRAIPCD